MNRSQHLGLFFVLFVLTLAASLRAQQPTPPPDTTFPLGALTAPLVGNPPASQQIPRFGLNMLYNGSPGVIGLDGGKKNPNYNADRLNYFIPGGTNSNGPTGGWNPLFAELDCDLATNLMDGTGAPTPGAWDVASNQTTNGGQFWGQAEGGINFPGSNPSTNGEWFIPGGTAQSFTINNQPYYLLNFDNQSTDNGNTWSEIIDPATFIGLIKDNNTPPENPNPATTFYIDFVYRVTGSSSSPEYILEFTPQTTSGTTITIQYSADDGGTWKAPETGNSWDNANVNNIPIYDGDYTNFVANAPTYHSQNNEIATLLSFPSAKLSPPKVPSYSPENYAILRIKVQLSGGTLLSNYPSGNSIACPISLNLRGVAANGIYVRGVRIRSDWADDLFRGNFDLTDASKNNDGNYLHSRIYGYDPNNNNNPLYLNLPNGLSDIYSAIYSNTGSTQWNSCLGFNFSNEPNTPSYRCFAYLNESFHSWAISHHHTPKNLIMFIAGTYNGVYTFWNPIYTDQSNGNPAPPLQMEGFAQAISQIEINEWYGNLIQASPLPQHWFPRPDHDFVSASPPTDNPVQGPNYLYAGDAVPAIIKNQPNFLEMGRAITGWNGQKQQQDNPSNTYGSTKLTAGTYQGTPATSTTPCSLSDLPSLNDDSDNYATYTWRWQSALSTYDGMNQQSAETSYPQNMIANAPTSWSSFWTYPSVFEISRAAASSTYPAIWLPIYANNLTLDNGSNPFDGSPFQKDLLTALQDGMPSHFYSWVMPFPSNETPSNLKNIEGDLTNTEQMPSAPEVRMQVWDAITWGAKGIIFDPIGSDGASNLGFCGDSWQDQVNSGFSGISNGDALAPPPGVTSSDWQANKQYNYGDWVTDAGINYLCFQANLSSNSPTGDNEPPNSEYWQSRYCYYGYFTAETITGYNATTNAPILSGYLIPPATTTSNNASDTWPDHLLITSDGNRGNANAHLWIPCLSDYNIYKNGGTPILSIGTPIGGNYRTNNSPPQGSDVNLDINNYLCGIQGQTIGSDVYTAKDANGNPPPTDLVDYYSQFLPGIWSCSTGSGNPPVTNSGASSGYFWLPAAHNGTAVSLSLNPDDDNWSGGDWAAYDRNLDADFNIISGCTASRDPNLYPMFQKLHAGQYDWWVIPFAFPQNSAPLAFTGVPTFYGMKERSDGVKRSMADIAPIAWELKQLQWVTSYNYANMTSSDNNLKHWATGRDAMSRNGFNMDGPHPSGDAEFPFKVLASEQVASNYTDPTNEIFHDGSEFKFPNSTPSTLTDENPNSPLPLYYNVGVFHDPNDRDAIYTTIANRRTWPMILNDTIIGGINDTLIRTVDNTTTTPYPYHGAIDARRIDLKLKSGTDNADTWDNYNSINPVTWTSSNSSVPFYTITNMRTGFDTTASTTPANLSFFSLDLEPGEGTLLRIAPATATEVGRTNSMAYNNGHRVAFLSPSCTAQPNQGVVWEQDGKILFSMVSGTNPIPAPSPQQIYPREHPADPQDAHNPSIACHPGQDAAIVFSVDDFVLGNNNNFPRSIWLATNSAPYSNSWHFTNLGSGLYYSTPALKDLTGNLPSGRHVNLLTPVVTPAQNDNYLVVYATEGGMVTYLVSSTGELISDPPIWSDPDQIRMISIASQNQEVSSPSDDQSLSGTLERFYFAWEEDAIGGGSSTIQYGFLDHAIGTQLWYKSPNTTISDACINVHPMIAAEAAWINSNHLSEFALPAVTWEVPGSPTQSVLREMTSPEIFPSTPAVWTSYTSFLPFASDGSNAYNVALPEFRYENLLCPGQSDNISKEIIYEDTFAREQFISRYDGSWSDAGRRHLKQYAQQGGLSMPYASTTNALTIDAPPGDPGYMTYRGIVQDESGDYATNLNVTPIWPSTASEVADVSAPTELIQNLNTVSNLNTYYCEIAIHYGGGNGKMDAVGPPTGPGTNMPTSVNWQFAAAGSFQEVPIDDSENVLQETSWPITQDTIRTNYFPATAVDTLEMGRVLEVDTTQLPTLLPDPTHYVSYKLVVKDSASQLITQVLDSIMIKGQGPEGGGYASYPGINPSDTTANGMGYFIVAPIMPTSSGSAYVTMIVTKDNATQAQLIQNQEYADTMLFPTPPDSSSDTSGGGGYKKLAPHPLSIGDTTQLVVTVHPNPVSGTVQICVEDVPGGAPVMVDVVNQLGGSIATLYNATPEGEIGLCLSLDCSKLPSGIYYADLQTEGMHHAVKFTVAH